MRRLYKTFYQFLIILSVTFVFQNLSAQTPTTPSTNLNFTSIDGNRFRVNFTAGDGAKRIIVAKEGSPVTNIPSDGTDYVPGAFGIGNEIVPGSGEYIVYEGTGSSNILISGLDHSTTYFLKIFEFNGSNFSTEYLTSDFLEGNETTLTNPTTQASNITFSNVLGTSMRVDWDAGNGTGRLLIAKAGSPVDVEPQQLVEYTNSSSFGSASTEIGNGNFVLSDGASTFVNVSNLLPGVIYHFAVFEYNGSSGKVYLTSTTSPSAPGATNSETTPTTPTENATAMDFTSVDGDRMRFLFFSNYYGNGAKRLIIAKAGSAVTATPVNGQSYTANDTFGDGQEIATDEFVVYNETAGNNILLSNLQPSTTYHFKVFEYNENGANTFYLTGPDSNSDPVFETSQATLSPPTTQASNFSFTNITGTSMTVNWDNTGDGNGRLLVAKAGSPVDATPQDFVEYAQSSNFGSASAEIGTDNYVIYDSLGSFANLTNLQPGVTYHFALFEYTGVSAKQYLTTNPLTGSQLTEAFPTENTTAMGFTSIDGDRMRFLFFGGDYGNGAKRLIIAKAGSAVTATPVNGQSYTANGSFGDGQEIATDEFVVYNETAGNNILLSNLQPSTTYHFKVFEYNENGANTFYLTGPDDNTDPVFETSQATLSPPTAQASNFSFSNITGSSMTVSWDNTGDGNGRLLVAKAGSPVDATPQDFVEYAQSSNFGSASAEIGTDNYVIYDSLGSFANLTNLQPGITYHFALFEYTGSSAKQYLTTNPLTGSQLTEAFPTENTTAMGFTGVDGDRMRFLFFTSYYGNGVKRLIIAKAGSAVTATPVNGQSYTANGSFGDGQEIAPDEFVVYNGTAGNNILLSNLQPSTTYHFKIFEYNENSINTFYLTGPDDNADPVFETTQSTLSPPTTNSNSAFFNSKTSTSFNLNWTNGDGSNRLLIIRENEPVNVEPQDFTTYSNFSGGFGNAFYEIGTGNYVVYSGTGNSVNVTNLNPGTNYYFELFEFNGSQGKLYLRPGFEFQEQTFGTTPIQQVTNPVYSVITSTSFVVDFTRGDGSHRLVLAKKDSPVDVTPTDLTSYNANTTFGAGDEIGSGNFVVYNDTGEDFQLNNLDPSSTYHLAFFEYSISATGELYLTPGLASSQTTGAPPCSIPANVSVSSINNTSAFFSWDPVATAINGFDYYLVSDSSVPDGTTTPTGTTAAGENSLLLTNLTEGTTYDFYVRSNCDNTNQSNWSNVVSFATLTDCYVANYSGNGNTGFGGVVGQSSLTFSDDGTTITGTFTKGTGDFNDAMIIYISTGATGRNVIDINVNDEQDPLRRAISQAGAEDSVVTFPSGFEATHAIAINVGFGGLWSIPATGTIGNDDLDFISGVGAPANNTDTSFTFSFDWSNIGLSTTNEFDFVITYLNSSNGFSSNEGYGNGIPTPNPGTNDFSFTSSESYPDYFYTFDGTTWSPSDPDGINEPCRRALIQSGSDTFSSTTTLDAIRVNSQAVLDIEANLSANLIFKSDATGSGQLDDTAGNVISGRTMVERYIPSKRAFRLLSSPVTTTEFILENWQQDGLNPGDAGYEANVGIQITGGTTGGFDQSGTNNPSMFTFDNTNDDGDGDQTNDWQELPNTDATKLNAGEPYLTLVRGDRSTNLFDASLAMPSETVLKVTGDLQTGTVTYDAAGTGADYLKLSNEDNFYSLVANPYQAVVDYSATTRSGLTDFIYVWDAKIAGDNGRGGYVTVTVTTGAPSPSSSDASEFIAPGMSFFVENDSDNTTTSQITFEEADKATAENQVDVFNTYPHFYINSRLYTAAGLQNGDTENDAIGLRFNSNYTTPGNCNEDSSKLFNPGENYAVFNNGLRSLDYQDIPQIGHEVNLSITNFQETNYSLTFVMENKPTGLGVFILDSYLNTQTELTGNFVYDFTVDANIPESIAEDRFSLVFDNTTLGIDENSFGANFRLYPNPSGNGQFRINTPNLSGEVNVELTNLLGQNVYAKQLSVTGNQVEVNASGLSTGIYVVKLTQDNQSYASKLIVD